MANNNNDIMQTVSTGSAIDESQNEANINLWMRFVLNGDIKAKIDQKLIGLSFKIKGNVCNLWDCLYKSLGNCVRNYRNSEELMNAIYALNSETEQDNLDHIAMKNLTRTHNIQLHFFSISSNLKDIIYGNQLLNLRCIHILHIGLHLFFPLTSSENSQNYILTEDDLKQISGLNKVSRDKFVDQRNLEFEKLTLLDIRGILKGREKTQDRVPEKNKNLNYFYEIHSPEELNYMTDLILCTLHIINPNCGEAYPLYRSVYMQHKQIKLTNRRNCGYNVFEGDKVYVKINNPKLGTGKVMGPFESNHKPVNNIYICKVSRDQGNLMIPLDKAFPKINVDNKPGRKRYQETHIDQLVKDKSKLSNQQKSISDLQREFVKYADNLYYSLFKVSFDGTDNIEFKLNKIVTFNPETCDRLFVVCYESWNPCYMYPNGKIVGVMSAYQSLEDNSHLIYTVCNIDTSAETDQYLKERNDIENTTKSILFVPNTYIPPNALVFTIDDNFATDLDDAISYHKEENYIVIGIHISDVTKYISPTDEIYQQAKNRYRTNYPPKSSKLTPVYLYGKELCTETFSLMPNKPRAVISAFFRFPEGSYHNNFQLSNIATPTFREGVIMSKYQLHYEDVSQWIREPKNFKDVDDILLKALVDIYEIARAIRRARLPKSYFVIQQKSFYKDFQIGKKTEAQILVEEFMILANENVAKLLFERYPNYTLLRVQDPVRNYEDWVDKLFQYTNMNFTGQLKEYCNLLKIPLFDMENKKKLMVSRKYYDMFCQFLENDIEKARKLLQHDILFNDFYLHITEWMDINPPARYECSIDGNRKLDHFSLKKPVYTHFTSPIRRFPDVIVHRLLKSLIRNVEIPDLSDEINEVCLISNRKSKDNKLFKSICNSYGILNQKDIKNCFILDCACSEINENGLCFVHPLLRKAAKVNIIKFSYMYLDTSPLQFSTDNNIENCNLKWRKIIYSFPPNNKVTSPNNKFIIDKHLYDSHLACSALDLFTGIRRSYKTAKEQKAKLRELKTKFENSKYDDFVSSDSVAIVDPIIDIELEVFVKQTMRIQFCKYQENAVQIIHPELYILTSTLQLCLIHLEDSERFFIPGGKLKLKYNDYKKKFHSKEEYKDYFEPLMHIESVLECIRDNFQYTLLNVPITWLAVNSIVTKRNERFGVIELPYEFCDYHNIVFNNEIKEIIDRWEYFLSNEKILTNGDLLCLRFKKQNWKNYWVGHGEVMHVGKLKNNVGIFKVIFFMLIQSDFDSFSCNHEEAKYTVEVYLKSIVSIRQQNAVLAVATQKVLQNIILGLDESKCKSNIHMRAFDKLPNAGLIKKIERKLQINLNKNQLKAITNAINLKLSLIWGPPGTGKTHIGCILSHLFTERNRNENKGIVLYCGPSNDCLNLVCLEMKKIFEDESPKVLRIFGKMQELGDFPLPGYFSKNHVELPNEIKEMSLHHLVRNCKGELSKKLNEFDLIFKNILTPSKEFKIDKKSLGDIHSYISEYNTTLKEAKKTFLKENKYDLVVCTTSVSVVIKKYFYIAQIIIDEAGMCKEPETLIPIANSANRVDNIVLIGDHKQLRPIIRSQLANKMGLKISLFERYQELRPDLVTLLNYQYRMHPSICEFPSREFYCGKLETRISKLWSGLTAENMINKNMYYSDEWNGVDYSHAYYNYKNDLQTSNYNAIPNENWPGKRTIPYDCFNRNFDMFPERIVFIQVVGNEVNQSMTTAMSNENSKGNREEVEVAGYIYGKLMDRCQPNNLAPKYVTVLTQYKLQQYFLEQKFHDILQSKKISSKPIVKTVISSQGSENDYIIFSTVRSISNKEDILFNPSHGWERQNLGFITDPNQVNVALTRARKGLIIIGNMELLRVNKLWNRLITDLDKRQCIIKNYLDFLP